jgi:hypothetical protein
MPPRRRPRQNHDTSPICANAKGKTEITKNYKAIASDSQISELLTSYAENMPLIFNDQMYNLEHEMTSLDVFDFLYIFYKVMGRRVLKPAAPQEPLKINLFSKRRQSRVFTKGRSATMPSRGTPKKDEEGAIRGKKDEETVMRAEKPNTRESSEENEEPRSPTIKELTPIREPQEMKETIQMFFSSMIETHKSTLKSGK